MQQGTCQWCFNSFLQKKSLSTDEFFAECSRLGLSGLDMVDAKDWPLLRKHGLICSMLWTHGIEKGINRLEHHADCLASIRTAIDAAAQNKFPNVLTFSGNCDGMSKEEGLQNCVTALKAVAPLAEQKGITLCLEFLNSKDHADYMADSTAWCMELVHRVNSPNVKVLYDIYHAAMMGEDVLADIRNHSDCWGHYHTAGVPGRHEIGARQSLDYAPIISAIAKTGYQGFICHEFIPENADGFSGLRDAIALVNANS